MNVMETHERQVLEQLAAQPARANHKNLCVTRSDCTLGLPCRSCRRCHSAGEMQRAQPTQHTVSPGSNSPFGRVPVSLPKGLGRSSKLSMLRYWSASDGRTPDARTTSMPELAPPPAPDPTSAADIDASGAGSESSTTPAARAEITRPLLRRRSCPHITANVESNTCPRAAGNGPGWMVRSVWYGNVALCERGGAGLGGPRATRGSRAALGTVARHQYRGLRSSSHAWSF